MGLLNIPLVCNYSSVLNNYASTSRTKNSSNILTRYMQNSSLLEFSSPLSCAKQPAVFVSAECIQNGAGGVHKGAD